MHEAGTRELAEYLRTKLIPEVVQQELMPDAHERIPDEEMKIILMRCETPSSKSLSAMKLVPLARVIPGEVDSGLPESASSNEAINTIHSKKLNPQRTQQRKKRRQQKLRKMKLKLSF